MKCAIGLLFNDELDNEVNALAWRVHCEDGIGIGCRRLPPHVSLKQPFEVGGLDGLEAVLPLMARFAAQIDPVLIRFGPLTAWETCLQYPAAPDDWLRKHHVRLNALLAEKFADPSAPFDGDAYQFHLTVAAGGVTPQAVRLASVRHAGSCLGPSMPTRLGVFSYTSVPDTDEWQYLCLRTMPLGGSGSSKSKSLRAGHLTIP